MRVVFTGYYGMANYGDDAFCFACARGARRYWQGTDVMFTSPPVTALEGVSYAVPAGYPSSWYASPQLPGRLGRALLKMAAIARADVLVHGGGSTLASLGRVERSVLHSLGMRARSTILGGLGLSIGPFHSMADERRVTRYLERFSFLSLRDRRSFDAALAMDLPYRPVLSRDLVGVLPLVHAPRATGSGRLTLGLSVCEYERFVGGDRELERRRLGAMLEGVRRFCTRTGADVRLFVLNAHPDFGEEKLSYWYHEQLQPAVQVEIIHHSRGVPAIWDAIAGCSLMLTVRLHGAITAYLTGVPFALVEYHRKCSDFVEDVGQPGELRLAREDASVARFLEVLSCLESSAPAPGLSRFRYAEEAAASFTSVPWFAEPYFRSGAGATGRSVDA